MPCGADPAPATPDTAILTLSSPALGFPGVPTPYLCAHGEPKPAQSRNRAMGQVAAPGRLTNSLTKYDLTAVGVGVVLGGKFCARPSSSVGSCGKRFRKAANYCRIPGRCVGCRRKGGSSRGTVGCLAGRTTGGSAATQSPPRPRGLRPAVFSANDVVPLDHRRDAHPRAAVFHAALDAHDLAERTHKDFRSVGNFRGQG